jgi:hypothetical protein
MEHIRHRSSTSLQFQLSQAGRVTSHGAREVPVPQEKRGDAKRLFAA